MNIIDRFRAAGRTPFAAPLGLACVLFCLACGIVGCADYYGPGGYAPGGYYSTGPRYAGAGYPYGYPGYGYPGYGYPGYGYGGGRVVVDINDRAYYTRGPAYYVGRSHYVWVPGHWNRSHTHWIHGHYVLRG